jgi:hypothetical protein
MEADTAISEKRSAAQRIWAVGFQIGNENISLLAFTALQKEAFV